MQSFRKFCRSAIDQLAHAYDVDIAGEWLPHLAESLVDEARHRAALLALELPGASGDAREYLARCLGASRPEAEMLTPPQVAQRYGVSPDSVRRWIATGELQAIDTASPTATRPRYRIRPEALAEFDRLRGTRKPNPARRKRPNKSALIVRRFSSDQ